MCTLEPVLYPKLLFAPPTDMPFGLDSGGSVFGAPRGRGSGADLGVDLFPSFNHGVDLFYRGREQSYQRVFAVTWGTVVGKEGGEEITLTVRHHPHSSGFFTVYRHLGTCRVSANDEVRPGEQLGTTMGDHLHFSVIRLADASEPLEATTPDGQKPNYVHLDPLPLLYRFEVNWMPEEGEVVLDLILPALFEQQDSYRRIERIRVRPWPERFKAATWLFEVVMPGAPTEGQWFYLPTHNSTPHEQLLVGMIRDAFSHGNRVKLEWRKSYFYGERLMIEDVRVKP